MIRTLQIIIVSWYLICAFGYHRTGNPDAGHLAVLVAVLMVLIMAKDDATKPTPKEPQP
jgi:hypothetical protein